MSYESWDPYVPLATGFVYLLVVAAALAPADSIPLIASSAALAAAAYVLAPRLQGTPISMYEVFALDVAIFVVLHLRRYFIFRGTGENVLAFTAAGVPVLMFWWCSLRWKPRPARARDYTLARVLLMAAVTAVLLSGVALLFVVRSTVSIETSEFLRYVVSAYFVGGLLTGFVFWLLQPSLHRATGRFALGILGGAAVYGAAGVALALSDGEAIRLADQFFSALAIGSIGGPAVAFGFDSSPAA